MTQAILALQLQIQLITAQLTAQRATMTPAQIQMYNWTPYEVATRVIPQSEENPPQ